MTKEEVFNLFKIEDLKDLPEAVETILFGDLKLRNEIYNTLLSLNNFDLSYDWFQDFYEQELSERKQKKQDFTPQEIGLLCAKLVGEGSIHEPTAGNGGMIIQKWWDSCRKVYPWEYLPSEHIVECWELSSRSIPILLLNLSIRGIMGYVYHGDVLEKTIKQRYILLNRNDSSMSFSEIIKASINDKIVEA